MHVHGGVLGIAECKIPIREERGSNRKVNRERKEGGRSRKRGGRER